MTTGTQVQAAAGVKNEWNRVHMNGTRWGHGGLLQEGSDKHNRAKQKTEKGQGSVLTREWEGH
jgi:hypothetical protein